MAKCTVGPQGPAFARPPESLRHKDPQLFDYLHAVHIAVFGAVPTTPPGTTTPAAPQGSLNEQNINVVNLAVDHRNTTHRDADGHIQYLTLDRHNAIRGNPHDVTADEVGRVIAQWNAEALQGVEVSASAPTDGQVLRYGAGVNEWVPSADSLVATLDSVECGVPIAGANGVLLSFASPVVVRIGTNGLPQAVLLRGVGLCLPDVDPPAAGRFAVQPGTPQTIVLAGNPPLASQFFGFLLVVTA